MIDPDTVQESTRDYWCQQQKSVCPQICLQQPGVSSMNTVSNECDAVSPPRASQSYQSSDLILLLQDTLQATCICDNNMSPNLTEFTQTLPYNICQQWGTNCVKACGQGENACADSCRADHPCGAQDPFKGNATMTSSSHSPTSKPTGTGSDNEASTTVPITGFAGQTGSANNDQPGAASSFGASYGLAVTIVGLFASLALL